MDAGTVGILVAAAGIVLWIVTQVHLLRVAGRIEANIDAKRTETQNFVDERLRALEANVGGFEARMTAQMPPNVDGRIADMEVALSGALDEIKAAVTGFNEARTQIAAIDQGIGAAFGALDSKLGAAFGSQGQSQLALAKMAQQAGTDLEGAMQGSLQNVDTNNPMVRQFYVWATKPVDEKWAAKHPFEAMLVQGGKMWFGQNVLPQLAGESAVEGVTRYGVSKGDKIL